MTLEFSVARCETRVELLRSNHYDTYSVVVRHELGGECEYHITIQDSHKVARVVRVRGFPPDAVRDAIVCQFLQQRPHLSLMGAV